MVITRETDYALRILRALLDSELHTIGEIAETELLPQPFAYKIIKKLSGAGMVQVIRGSAGGCRLVGDLSKLSLYDLMLVTGERSDLTACMDSHYACPWRESHGGCTIHCKLAQIQENLDQELKANNLMDLLTD